MTELPLFLNRCISWRLFQSIWEWEISQSRHALFNISRPAIIINKKESANLYLICTLSTMTIVLNNIEHGNYRHYASSNLNIYVHTYTHIHSDIYAVILLYTSHSWVNCKFPSSFCINYLCTSFYGCAKCRDTPPPRHPPPLPWLV